MGATRRGGQRAGKRLAGRGMVGDNVGMSIQEDNGKSMQIARSDAADAVKLPGELLDRLHVKDGDRVHVEQAPDGSVIIAVDQEHARQMAAARKAMREDHEVLRKLAQ